MAYWITFQSLQNLLESCISISVGVEKREDIQVSEQINSLSNEGKKSTRLSPNTGVLQSLQSGFVKKLGHSAEEEYGFLTAIGQQYNFYRSFLFVPQSSGIKARSDTSVFQFPPMKTAPFTRQRWFSFFPRTKWALSKGWKSCHFSPATPGRSSLCT